MIQKEIPFHSVKIINMPTRVPPVNYLSVSDSQNVALSPLHGSILQHNRELKYLEKQKNPDNKGVAERKRSIQSRSVYIQLNPGSASGAGSEPAQPCGTCVTSLQPLSCLCQPQNYSEETLVFSLHGANPHLQGLYHKLCLMQSCGYAPCRHKLLWKQYSYI